MSTVTLAASAPAAPSPRLPPVVYSENQRRMRILASVREPAAFHAKTAASVDARQTASQEPAHPLALHHGSPRAGWLSVPVFLALFFLAFFSFFFLALSISTWNRWGTLVSVLRAIKALLSPVLRPIKALNRHWNRWGTLVSHRGLLTSFNLF